MKNNTTSNNKIKVGRAKWYSENTEPVPLCKGVEIDSSVYEISENRYLTLVIKGLIVYLVTAGGIGAYLTAIDIDFNQVVFNIVIFVTAIICAALYHSCCWMGMRIDPFACCFCLQGYLYCLCIPGQG